MGYANDLVRLLRPLGFYSFEEGSFSLAELQALGSALDALDAHAQAGQRESIVMTAAGEGLERMLALFRRASKPSAPPSRAFSGSAATALRSRRCEAACPRAA